MTIAILIISILAVIGLVVWLIIKNNKPKPTPVPDTGDTPSSGDTPDTGDTPTPPEPTPEPSCTADSETHRIQNCVSFTASDERVKIGWYDTDKICDGVWSIKGHEGDEFISNIEFENGDITGIVSATNKGKERTTRYITHFEGSNASKDDFFDVTQCMAIDEEFEGMINAFRPYIDVKDGSLTYDYVKELYDEAKAQFNGKSLNGIPLLYKEENFPNIYNFYGDAGDDESALKSMLGWVVALPLAELKPYERTNIFKVGYEIGGYDRYSNIYGYKFKCDPNVARLVASAVYVTMRGKKSPNTDAMRKEVGGEKYSKTLAELGDGGRSDVAKSDFFTDFREFMPTAPGPYAPSYKRRPDNTYPNESKDEYKNLSVDREIHEYIVKNYNLNDKNYFQAAVQAIADEEGCANHLFGDNVKTDDFTFHPAFGVDTIGVRLSSDGYIAKLSTDSQAASSSSRGILQSASVTPRQYGRLRPGCSWDGEGEKNSKSDDRRNVLCDIDIEDNDGCKDSSNSIGYYNKDGIWVHTQVEEDKFCESQKKTLYANSYPSGHSAGIWGAAMSLMEIMPDKADKLITAANSFAVNRTIARYHWTSDTINGRVLGSATNAVSHAASDYDELLNKARKEL